MTIAITVFAAALTSCGGAGRQKGAAEKQPHDSLRSVIATARVEVRPMSDELLLNGDVACDESLVGKVFLPCTGRVSGVSVEVGDRVSRGQTLAVVHSSEAAGQSADASAAEAQLSVAKRELQMKQEMHASGMASDKEVAEARAQVAQLRAQIERLAATRAIGRYGRGAVAVLKAPIAGYVTAKSIYNDSYVGDGAGDVPAFEVADISRVWVIADVYESDIAKVHQGSRVAVSTMAYPGLSLSGTIDKVYSMIDADSKTMKVRITLRNPGGRLKPGMFATVSVQLDGVGRRAISVPAQAVVFENGSSYVVACRAGGYQRCKVTPLHASDSRVWLAGGGVCEGDTVVARNALLVYNALGD